MENRVTNKTLANLLSVNREKMEQAFNTIYSEYSYLVYYVSLSILKSDDLAKEITNETFFNFYEKRNSIKNAKAIKYYLLQTSKNLSLNYLNHTSKVQELTNNVSQVSLVVDDYQSYLERFKSFLDEDEINLIVLHLLYDFSFKEIANDKNVSINAITSKYTRCIEKIRKYYEVK